MSAGYAGTADAAVVVGERITRQRQLGAHVPPARHQEVDPGIGVAFRGAPGLDRPAEHRHAHHVPTPRGDEPEQRGPCAPRIHVWRGERHGHTVGVDLETRQHGRGGRGQQAQQAIVVDVGYPEALDASLWSAEHGSSSTPATGRRASHPASRVGCVRRGPERGSDPSGSLADVPDRVERKLR